MESFNENIIFDQVADNIKANVNQINKILSNCSIQSNFATQVTEEKFQKILSVDTKSIIKNEPSSEYYDLNKASSIMQMLDVCKSHDVHKKFIPRSNSVSSIHSTCEDDSDNLNEIMNQMREMRDILKSMENTCIDELDLNEIRLQETTRNNEFFELVFSLQKLARELTSIAATDSHKKERFPPNIIDNNFINKLDKLDKCLDSMLKLEIDKNPIANIERKDEIVLELSEQMNTILQAIKNNSI